MGKKIEQAEVVKVAKLSRLELTDKETTEFSSQLSAILEYVEKMNEVNTDDVLPLAHCLEINNVLREDIAGESLGAEKVLANAPQKDGSFFKMPKILEDSSS